MLRQVLDVARDPVRLARYLGRLVSDPRVPTGAKVGLFGSAVYLWIDGDLISDTLSLIPGLGYVDDLALIVHGVRGLVAAAGPELAVELWPGDEASFRRTMLAVVWIDDQLYGRARALVRALLGRLIGTVPSARPPASVQGA
ncbi:MAG: hypothetical protein IT371_23685 [Deltaproteobacteria bacterium]|nr:hypothetical protein [Deltaproteobacteria bacterium]